MSADKRLDDIAAVFRFIVLQQGALIEFFFRCFWNIDRFHCLWVESGIEHAGGVCTRSWVEVLYLLRAHVVF